MKLDFDRLGNSLYNLFLESNIDSLTKLSEIAKINRQHIHKIFKDEASPNFCTLKKLLNALGYNLAVTKKD